MGNPHVVVCGLAGSVPVGGMGLHYLQYCLGLRELGVEVLYMDPAGEYHGTSQQDVHGWCSSADLLINVSGGLMPFEHHRQAARLA